MYQEFVGTQNCTIAAGQAVGASGKATRVFFVHIISGGTAGEIKLFNDIATIAANLFVQEKCSVVSTGNTISYGKEGILFPNGCFYSEVVDANVTSTLIGFAQESFSQ